MKDSTVSIEAGVDWDGTNGLRRAGELAQREFELNIMLGCDAEYALSEVICTLFNAGFLKVI